MKLSFCTLFNSYYLTRGIALFNSLSRVCSDFNLYVVAFDEETKKNLNNLNHKNLIIISLEEFEDKDLLEVKKFRTLGEYCWTCTPSIIKFCIEKFNLEMCTYLDADLYFFSDPSLLLLNFDEDVLITPHNYTPKFDQTDTSGIYCVQFMPFKNNLNGMKVLNWWRDKCIEWCFNRHEEGRFGDQMYLDDWPTRFENIKVDNTRGLGVAPWNIQNFEYKSNDEILFYHFHDFKFISDSKVDLGVYPLRAIDIEQIYTPYLKEMKAIEKELNIPNPHKIIRKKYSFLDSLRNFKRRLKGNYNIINF